MKHKMGNAPKCYECFFYSDKEQGDGCMGEGWCRNPHQLQYGVNGRKREKPLEKYAVNRNHECNWWEDAETRDTHFDVVTGKVRERGNQLTMSEVIK